MLIFLRNSSLFILIWSSSVVICLWSSNVFLCNCRISPLYFMEKQCFYMIMEHPVGTNSVFYMLMEHECVIFLWSISVLYSYGPSVCYILMEHQCFYFLMEKKSVIFLCSSSVCIC